MNKTFFLIAILLFSTVYQPIHNYLIASGVSMTPEVHSLVTMAPFLVVSLLLIPTRPESEKSRKPKSEKTSGSERLSVDKYRNYQSK